MNLIKGISSKGIEYLNDKTNLIEFIDFQICNNNWVEYQIMKRKLNDIDGQKFRERDRNIGQRDICANPCYIKFFTKPNMVKIEFNNKDEFEKIRDAIIQYGWRTLDLS